MKALSHQYAYAGTKVKVICKGQGQILRLHFSKKMAVSGAFMFHKHILLAPLAEGQRAIVMAWWLFL